MDEHPLPETGVSNAHEPEIQQRFARLRRLIHDEQRRHRLLLVGTLIAVAVVVGLTLLARLYTVLPIDVWFTLELQERHWPVVSRVMYAISIFGYTPWSAVTVAAGVVLIGLLLGWRDGLYLLAITIIQGLLNSAIKLGIGRPRPVKGIIDVFVPEHGFSFPSGHVMFYTVFFGFIAFLVLTRLPHTRPRWFLGVPLLALVVLVGPSRIILGAHWLSDVIAAYLIGVVLLALAIELYVHRLAPQAPAAEGGLMRRYDTLQ
jgi:membrane-associated phospholipid phosphatase